MKRALSIGGVSVWLLLSWFSFLISTPRAQHCSALSQCATGCCNKGGYCGIGDAYCGADCVANCDYQPECDASRPCAKGCCNKYGYCGLGPDFCATDVCIGNCDRKSECDPDDYIDFAESAKCPLNVCCSKFGFCGTTEEFCGKKNVKRPSCSNDGSLNRVVGYYEGWSPQRPCHAFYPEQIPMGVYTHLNYAFATIDPESFEILPAADYEKDLMNRLTDLKKIDPDLRVFVAVGGWTFNDPRATQTVFSDLARSESNQKKFFASLQSFLATYDFDGIDLDWEYPVADDRGGRKEDFDNFPKFMSNLKKALKQTGGRDGLSITLPASYWYLQHFDIANLQKHVDFFNIMTYDIHGKWDLGNQWLEPILDSHTNLTEITNALDLLWRNDIKSEKVVMGLAFYGRVFAAADTNCMDPGCLFASGGNPGKCSNEAGILLNSEIMDIMNEQSLQSTFDKEAAVKILKFDDTQWLTYDNGDTFKLRTDFAKSQCLGGVMVWAVSHDLPYGNFSRVLGEAVGREVAALALNEDKDSLEVKNTHQQCKWTNCNEDCPSGWSRIRRGDDGAREDEHMWDNTGCGAGQHTFCCPPNADLPKCGWYTHNNGNCKSECPSGYVEVGSNFQHCSNNANDYQAACCTMDTPSTKLYSQCSWEGKAPKCKEGQCSSDQTEVALSTTGSGGTFCNPATVKLTLTGQEATYQERPYCCKQDDNTKWSDCQWYDDVGTLMDASITVDGFCWSGCPNDRVRVALDQHGGGCKGDGGRAKCCVPKYTTISKRSYTDSEKKLEASMEEFMDDPSCGLDDYVMKRDLVGIAYSMGNISLSDGTYSLSTLERRASSKARESMDELMFQLFVSYTANAAAQEIWKKHVVSVFPNLAIQTVRAYMSTTREWVEQGARAFLDLLACNMALFNSKLGDLDVVSCKCTTKDCCDSTGEDACSDDPDDDGLSKRDLEKRARSNTLVLDDGNGNVVVVSWDYTRRGAIPPNDPILNAVYEYADEADCLNSDIGTTQIGLTSIMLYQIEHIMELNTIVRFLRNAHAGTLPSGTTARNGRLSATFIRQALNAPILNNPPVMTGGDQSLIPISRAMHALGSTLNSAGFTLLLTRLNNVKSRIWRGENPTSDTKMEAAIKKDGPEAALKYLREPLTILAYLNHPVVNSRMISASNTVRDAWGLADEVWENGGNAGEFVQDWWDEWIRDSLKHDAKFVREWVERWAKKMIQYWAVRTGDQALQVNEILASLRRLASDAEIGVTGLD